MKSGEYEYFLEEGSRPVGVVLVHEIFGLNNYIKSVANEFSKNGYWAAVVDIFRGKKLATLEEGRKIRESLTKEEVVDALGNGLKLLRTRIGDNAQSWDYGFLHGWRLRVAGCVQS